MNILVAMPRGELRDSFIPPYVAEAIETLGDVDWNESDLHLGGDELKARLKGVDAVITGWGCAEYTPEILRGADSLKVIAHTGGSVATLVGQAVYDRGIQVISGNDLFAKSVAEGVVAYALASLRDIPRYAGEMAQKGWADEGWWSQGLWGQSVGLIGFGAIPKHLVPLLHAFEAKIKVHADHVTPQEEAQYGITKVGLEEIFTTCKIVSLHTAKTPETYHMIDGRLLDMLPDGALFINTARGACVDEAALADRARTGRFRVVLDVYEEEPLPLSSPLRGLENVLLMPHMAGPTVDRREHITMAIVQDLRAIQQGKAPLLAISREAAARMTR